MNCQGALPRHPRSLLSGSNLVSLGQMSRVNRGCSPLRPYGLESYESTNGEPYASRPIASQITESTPGSWKASQKARFDLSAAKAQVHPCFVERPKGIRPQSVAETPDSLLSSSLTRRADIAFESSAHAEKQNRSREQQAASTLFMRPNTSCRGLGEVARHRPVRGGHHLPSAARACRQQDDLNPRHAYSPCAGYARGSAAGARR